MPKGKNFIRKVGRVRVRTAEQKLLQVIFPIRPPVRHASQHTEGIFLRKLDGLQHSPVFFITPVNIGHSKVAGLNLYLKNCGQPYPDIIVAGCGLLLSKPMERQC